MDLPTREIVAKSLRDLKFISRQIIRFSRMSPKELIAHARSNPHDILCTIQHPRGKGRIYCGTLAWKKFGEIADLLITSNPNLAGRVSRDRVKTDIVDAYLQHVLVQGREFDSASVRQMLNSVAAKAELLRYDTEHFLPCVLFMHGGPDEFSLGPVTFTRRSKFFLARKHALREGARKAEEAHIAHVGKAVEEGFPRDRAASRKQSRQLVRNLQARVIKTYRGYPWVACVRIVNCDRDMSKELAIRVVETALHVIRIMLGASRTSKVRLAWSRSDTLRTAALWADEDGVVHAEVGFRSMGPVGLENWYDGLIQRGEYELQVFGSALMPLADPKELTELHARFIDAINWFGDAATDIEPTASVVKYTSAIERLFFGVYGRDRQKSFAKRVRAVLEAFDCAYEGDIYADSVRVYTGRSGLLHGGSSPRSSDGRELAIVAETLARLCLLCSTQLYPMILRAYENPDANKLDECMRLIEAGELDTLAQQAGYSLTSCAS